MQFHILDENSNPVAIMDNTLSEAIHLKSSKFQSFATGSANYLDFEIDKLHVDSSMFQVGYWIIFKHRGKDQKLYINNVEEAEKDTLMQISAKSANLDLNIEKITPPAPMTAQPITWYFNIILSDTGYTIGTNELSNLTRKLSWDSEEMTRRTLLQSVANQFDKGELEYEEILNSDFTTKERLVHIKKQVGEIRDDIELEYGKNVKTIKRATNIDNMCTAVRPTTTNKDGKVTTIVNEPDWQVLDDDGNIKFYHKKGSEIIFAPIANARYGNRGTNVTSGGYILHKINYENISSSETFTRGKTYIEEYSVPEITYEAEGRTDANPGDTVTIIDKGYNPPLLLSARVLDITDSFDDPTLEGANFGNYKALESQISDDLISKMQKLAEENAPYKATTLTTNGLTFKNSQGSTILTARLFKGTKEIVPDSYIWTKDNITLSVAESTLTVDASDINVKSVVRWSAVINGNVVAFDEVTIVDVSDGKQGVDGKTYYTHTAYAYSADGTDRFTTTYPSYLNLFKGTRTPKSLTGNNTFNQVVTPYFFDNGKNVKNQDLSVGDTLTCEFDWSVTNPTSGLFYVQLNGTNWQKLSQNISITSENHSGHSKLSFVVDAGFLAGVASATRIRADYLPTDSVITISNVNFTKGLTATPWMPSSSEVKTSDYPSYIGTYSDTNVNGSTDHSKYTWTVFKGADGRGVSSVAQKWLVQSSSIKPNYVWTDSMWQTTLPAMSATNKYLYTIERTTYTDTTTSDVITLSAIYGDKGDQGNPGSPGAPGSNGQDAITIVLSNENVTLPANSLGVVTSYANSNTTIGVTYGSGADLTPVASGATLTNNQYKVTAAASGITAGTQSVDVDNKKVNFSIASGMNETSGAVASITYTISIRNSAGVTSTVTKVQNFTKAEKGITGDKGIDSYTYIRYSASSNGASMTNLPGADSLYIGTCTTTQATAPTEAGSYVWAKFVGEDGAKGDPTGITQSMTEPITRYTGMLWQYTGADNLVATGITALPNSLYVWTGSAWQLYLVKSTNLQVDNGFITNAMIGDAQIESAKIKSLDAWKINADSLEALSAKIGKISNTFDNSSGGIDNKGEIAIEDSVKVVYYNANTRTTIDLVTSTSGQGLFAQYLPDKNDTTKFQQAWYTPSYLYFSDSINNWTGQITAENVTLSSWQNLILQSGFTAGDGVQPQYRRIKNLDGSYSVQFRGAISPTSGNFPTTQLQVATLSGIYLPPTKAMRQGSDSTGKGGRVAVVPTGQFYIWAPNTSSYVYIDALTYIN